MLTYAEEEAAAKAAADKAAADAKVLVCFT